jgi:hypothetical protein
MYDKNLISIQNLISIKEDRNIGRERAIEFGRSMGWILSQKDFNLRQLKNGIPAITSQPLYGPYENRWDGYERPIIDHPDFYRYAVKPYRPAAIITHSCCTDKDIQEWAKSVGLVATVLPESWYAAEAVAVLLTPA